MAENRLKQDFGSLKAAYLQHLQLKNYAALTLRQIEQALRVFVVYIQGRGVADVGGVDRAAFEQYKAHLSGDYVTLKGTPLSTQTIHGRLLSIQRWFDFMRKKGFILHNPIGDVQVPRPGKRLPRGVMRPDEIRRVMEQPDLKTLVGYRDRTMMEVLYATGARANELLTVRLPDVDFEKKVLRIRNGKGGRQRFVPLSTPACRFLDRYIKEVRPELIECVRPAGNNWKAKFGTGGDLVFLSLYGGPLSRTWLGSVMKQYIRKAGITRPLSPVHGFRHSVATHLLENGMDVRYVQAFLGHNTITSTQIYTHVERKTLKKLLKDFHPREKAGETPLPFVETEDHRVAVA